MLRKADCAGWSLIRVEKEMKERLLRAMKIRNDAGGSWVGLNKAQSADLHAVAKELEILGERRDALAGLETGWSDMSAAEVIDQLQHDIDTPASPMIHPRGDGGHRRGNYDLPGKARPSGWGDAFVKGLEKKYGLKDLTPSGSISVPALVGTIVRVPDRPRSILELIPFEPLVNTDSWAFIRETERTHAAAAVGSGAQKPRSTYRLEKIERSAKTIAHLTEPIDRTDLSDVPQLMQYVDGALREGVQLELEDQVLSGDGTGPNIEGISNTSGIGVQVFDGSALRTARLAVAVLEEENIDPDDAAFVLSVRDWAEIELSEGADEHFKFDDNRVPVDSARRRMWGVRVVPTTAQADGTGLLVDFRGSTQGVERENVRIDFSENLYDPDRFGVGEGGSDFEANQIVFRGEGRFDSR